MDYTSVAGIIQFDVDEREVNGGLVRDATIRSFATGELRRITVWPEFKDTEFERGDVLFVDGDVRVNEYKGKEYTNINARRLAVVPQAVPAEREVEAAERPSSF